ncbi:MAG: hypothetical protein QM765_53690 [Myxococcales bacterium]
MTLQATEPLAAGSRLGEFCELVRPIFQGPEGALWEARGLAEAKPVSVFLPGGAVSAERLLQQAQAAARTGHAAIAQVLHADALPSGAPVLVLEALPGETVAAARAKGPLSLDEALRVGREVALALSAAHREKVFHGALSANCVVLCPRESAPAQVKVLGFGTGPVEADAATEVAALAKLVHALLASDPSRPVQALEFQAPQRVVDALERALDPDPSQRFSDVVAFMAACSGRAVKESDQGFMRFADIEEEATLLKPPEKPADAAATSSAPAQAPAAVAVAREKPGRAWTVAVAVAAIAVAIVVLVFFFAKAPAPPSPVAPVTAPAEAQP